MALSRVIRLLDNVINLNENAIINEILSNKDFQQFIIDLNTGDQLFEEGINALGVSLESIGGPYTEATIHGIPGVFKGKLDKGQPIDRITLKDTGDFYKTFKIVLGESSFQIEADGKKDGDNLFTRWGKDVVGLTDENTQKVIDAIRKRIVPIIRERIAA